jgi:hypothetical protein
MTAHVSQVGDMTWPVLEGLEFSLVDVDRSVGKVGEATAVIEMHVAKNHVTDLLRVEPKTSDLSDSCFLGVHGYLRDGLEHTEDAWWTKIVVKARASIDQDKPLIGADQEAKSASAPSAREAGTASEAVEKVDVHG